MRTSTTTREQLPQRSEETAEAPREPRRPTRWKLVVAADEPWSGEIYETRAGRRRESFDGPAEFIEALMRLTDWEWPTVEQ